MKPGDFVRFRGSTPPAYAQVTEVNGDRLYLKRFDGWPEEVRGDATACVVVDLAEVWRALEVEQSRIDRRLADLQELKARAFERALTAGRP